MAEVSGDMVENNRDDFRVGGAREKQDRFSWIQCFPWESIILGKAIMIKFLGGGSDLPGGTK